MLMRMLKLMPVRICMRGEGEGGVSCGALGACVRGGGALCTRRAAAARRVRCRAGTG